MDKKIAPRKPPKVSDEIAKEIARELRRIGVNFNQIAKQLNIDIKTGRDLGYHNDKLTHYMDMVSERLEKIWHILN